MKILELLHKNISFVFAFVLRKTHLQILFFKLAWRLKNKNNKTLPVYLFNSSLVSVGKMSYGPLIVHESGAENESLKIGSYVSISSGVKFILGGNHNIKTFTTFPHRYMSWGMGVEATSKGPIIVHDDVWIGTDALILSGVSLGKGCIVAAGSVVTKSVPAFAVVGGNPARIIKFRFSQEIRSRLEIIDFNLINWVELKKLDRLFYSELEDETLSQIEHALIRVKN